MVAATSRGSGAWRTSATSTRAYIAAVAVRSSGLAVASGAEELPEVQRALSEQGEQMSTELGQCRRGSARHATPGGQATELVETGLRARQRGAMPIMITPAVDNVDLAGWCAGHTRRARRATSTATARSCSAASLCETAGDFEAVAVDHRRRPVRRLRRPAARERGREGLRLDALPARQDDPLPQRELAPALVAAAPVLLLRHPVDRPGHDAAAGLPRGTTSALEPEILEQFEPRACSTSATSPRASTCPGRSSSRPRTGPRSSGSAPKPA